MFIYEEIIKDFHKRHVKYVIVGGIAVNLLGSYRGTVDLDLIVEMSSENLSKIWKILEKNGYRLKQPVKIDDITDNKKRNELIAQKNLTALCFYKKEGLGEVDLIIKTPVSYKNADKTAVEINVGSLKLHVASIDDLIKIKKKTGRAVDKFDINELTKIKKLKDRARK